MKTGASAIAAAIITWRRAGALTAGGSTDAAIAEGSGRTACRGGSLVSTSSAKASSSPTIGSGRCLPTSDTSSSGTGRRAPIADCAEFSMPFGKGKVVRGSLPEGGSGTGRTRSRTRMQLLGLKNLGLDKPPALAVAVAAVSSCRMVQKHFGE